MFVLLAYFLNFNPNNTAMASSRAGQAVIVRRKNVVVVGAARGLVECFGRHGAIGPVALAKGFVHQTGTNPFPEFDRGDDFTDGRDDLDGISGFQPQLFGRDRIDLDHIEIPLITGIGIQHLIVPGCVGGAPLPVEAGPGLGEDQRILLFISVPQGRFVMGNKGFFTLGGVIAQPQDLVYAGLMLDGMLVERFFQRLTVQLKLLGFGLEVIPAGSVGVALAAPDPLGRIILPGGDVVTLSDILAGPDRMGNDAGGDILELAAVGGRLAGDRILDRKSVV